MPNPDYRKMFEDLDASDSSPDDLDVLATIMSGRTRFIQPIHTFTDIANNAEAASIPQIPAGYTYLAQFLAHDISFDEVTDRHRRSDRPWKILDPLLIKELKNLRRPNFDLETVYGYDAPSNRGEISRNSLFRQQNLIHWRPFLKVGMTDGVDPSTDPAEGADPGKAAFPYPCDLPRGRVSVDARIVDPRNDENLLLAQTLVAFIKFHNAIVMRLSESVTVTNENWRQTAGELFHKARRLTIRYYQTIILKDFLPRFVQKSVLTDVRNEFNPRKKKLFYEPDMFIPLEFAVAAFRFGHSMIREKYNLNVKHLGENAAKLRDLMMNTGRGEMDSSPSSKAIRRLELTSIWIIDWNLFYPISNSTVNQAEPINTELPVSLLRLAPSVSDHPEGRANSLAALDLFRGWSFGLPSGQDVAGKLGIDPLPADKIAELIMRKVISIPDATAEQKQEFEEKKIQARDVFSAKTPLWFYILAEAEIQTDEEVEAGQIKDAGKLGAVGSRIVAETFVQLLYHSEYSILQHEWEEGEDELSLLTGDNYLDMPAMLKFIQDTNAKYHAQLYEGAEKFDELNPLGDG